MHNMYAFSQYIQYFLHTFNAKATVYTELAVEFFNAVSTSCSLYFYTTAIVLTTTNHYTSLLTCAVEGSYVIRLSMPLLPAELLLESNI